VPIARLTDLIVRNAKPPLKGQFTLWDSSLKHFGLRLSQGGAKTFTVMHGALRERITIGRYPLISLAQAREKAKEILADRTLNRDRKPNIKFDAAQQIFFAVKKQKCKASTVAQYERLFKRHLFPTLQYRKLADIKPHDITHIIDRLLRTPSECNHLYGMAQTFFRWATRRKYISRSPMEDMEKPTKYRPRERVLTDQELVAVWRAAEKYGYPFGAIVQLLILTGQRRSEIGKLKWAYIAESEVTLPSEIVKNNRAHTIPLGGWAARILKETPNLGEYVFMARGNKKSFNGWQSCTFKLIQSCGTAHWTLHDLRRTFATNLAALGVAPHVVEKLLNHTGALSGVALIYNRYTFAKECREAVEKWEAHFASLLAQNTVANQSHAPVSCYA
jgi:integrase